MANMRRMPISKEHNGNGLVEKTFTDRMTIGKGAGQLDLWMTSWMQAQLEAGITPEEAAKEFKVPEKYKDDSSQVSPLFGGLGGRIQALRDEMQTQK